MFIPPPLLADLDDIIKVVFFLIVGAFWLIRQLMGQEAAKPKKPAAPPRIPPPVPAAPGQAARGQGPLQDEVSDFLRRATLRKGNVQEARGEAFAYQAPPAKKKRGEKTSKSKRARDLKERHDVDEHVRDRLDTSKFSDRAEQLGDLVETSNQEFQEHVQEKFSHDLGRLTQSGAGETVTTADAVAASSATAAGLAAASVAPAVAIAELLRRPESVRQAIILQEILKRPGQR